MSASVEFISFAKKVAIDFSSFFSQGICEIKTGVHGTTCCVGTADNVRILGM